jgi:DNA-binding cell septation regulator SpoVG
MTEPSTNPENRSSSKSIPATSGFRRSVLTRIAVVSVREGSGGSAAAFADVELEFGSAGRLRIYGCAVMEGDKGLWVSWPRRKGEGEKWYDIIRPEGGLAKQMATAVLAEYNAQFGIGGEEAAAGEGA